MSEETYNRGEDIFCDPLLPPQSELDFTSRYIRRLQDEVAYMRHRYDCAVKDCDGYAYNLDQFRHECDALYQFIRELSAFASAHHPMQDASLWLHALTVDIPNMIDRFRYPFQKHTDETPELPDP
jgi:hypothetical protein